MGLDQYFVHKNYNRQEIQDVSFEKLATDPLIGDLYEGRFWYNTTDQRLKHYKNSAICTVACLTDIASIGAFQGAHDATSGIPAGAGLSAGDFWRVSVAGNIAGIVGVTALETNDMIYALIDNPTLPSHFSSVQANTDHAGIGFTEEQTVNLVSATELTVTPTNFSGKIHSWKVMLSTGEDITDGVQIIKDNGANTLKITSNVALSNVLVSMIGIN